MRSLLLASALLVMPLAGLAEGTAAAVPGGPTVTMGFDPAKGSFFMPKDLTVPVGTTVTFANTDGSNHNVVFKDGPKSGRLRHEAVWTRTFAAAGSYPYECAIHGAAMSGVITVK